MLLIGWTTVTAREQADHLAQEAIARGWAVCAQIDGPITSIYRWQGGIESATEYRLTLKFLETQRTALSEWLEQAHPYDTPQWIVVTATQVAEKYLSWAQGNATPPCL